MVATGWTRVRMTQSMRGAGMNQATFAARYQNEPDEALVALQETIEDLVPEAQAALEAEIERRGVDANSVRARGVVIDAAVKTRKSAALKRTLYFLAGMTLAIFTLGAFGIQLGAIPYMAVLAASGLLAQWLLIMAFNKRR